MIFFISFGIGMLLLGFWICITTSFFKYVVTLRIFHLRQELLIAKVEKKSKIKHEIDILDNYKIELR